MKLKLFVFTIVVIAGWGDVASQSVFESVVERILLNDCTLNAGRLEREAAIAADRSENVLDAPEVEAEYLWAHNPGEKNRVGFSVSQSFEWPGMYGARRKVIEAKSSAAEMLYLSELAERRLAVRQLLIDIVYTRRRILMATDVCEIFDSLLVKYKSGYERGEFSKFDYSKIRIERVRSQRSIMDLKMQLNQLMTSLSIYNGGRSVGEIVEQLAEFPSATLYSRAEYEQAYAIANPAMKSAALDAEIARAQLSVDKNKMLPDFSLGYRFAREDGNNFHGLVFGFNLPFLYKTKAQLKSSKLLIESTESKMTALSIAMNAELIASYVQVSSLRDKLSDLLSAADIGDCRRMLQKALAGGEISLVQYLLEMNYYTELESEILDFEYRYHLALARLNRYM